MAVVGYLQSVEIGQPDTVTPTQIPSKVVMADINGLQVPSLIPEEIQHIYSLERRQEIHRRDVVLLAEVLSKYYHPNFTLPAVR